MIITGLKKCVNSSALHLGRCLAAIVWLVRILKWAWLKQRSRNVVFSTKLVHHLRCVRCLRWRGKSASVRRISEHHVFFHANPLTSKTGSHNHACHRSDTTLIRNTRSTWMYPGIFCSGAAPVSTHHRRAEGTDLASKLPSSQSNRAFMGCHGSHAVPNTHTHTPPQKWITGENTRRSMQQEVTEGIKRN